MNKIKILISTLIFTFVLGISAYAGTGVIQFGDPKTTRDKTFTLTVKVKSTDVRLKTATITIQYNPNMVEFQSGTDSSGSAGTVKISGVGESKGASTKTLTYNLKFKALYRGTTDVTIVDQEVYDTSDKLVNITKLGTSKITINPINSQSKNANLATLEFTPGEIDKTFDQNVIDYNTEVNSDVVSLVINAIPEDKDAVVTVTGNENFSTGMNKVEITVVAPDGKTEKNYVLNVTKLETGVTAGDTTITNGQKLTSNKYTVTIMMKPEDISIPSGYIKSSGEFGGSTSEAYVSSNINNETPEVFLVYGMNQDGDTGFYRIDSRDNTIQRYVEDANAGDYAELSQNYETLVTRYNEMTRKYNVLFPGIIALAVVVLILIIVLIILLIKGGGNSKKQNKYAYNYDDEEDDDDDYFSPTKNNNEDYNSGVSMNNVGAYTNNASSDEIEDLD